MAGFFKNYAAQANISERQILEVKYNNSRHNILLLIIFTVINAVLLLTRAGSYFLFSAYVPYFMIDLGMLMCGRYPEEFYTEELNGMVLLDESFLVMMCVFAAIIMGLYALCWLFSKKRSGWLVTAVVFVSLDTLAMVLMMGFSGSVILDYFFHAYVIYALASGIAAHKRLKRLPVEEAVLEVNEFEEVAADVVAEPIEAVAEIVPEENEEQ
jgi:hypothetical protein